MERQGRSGTLGTGGKRTQRGCCWRLLNAHEFSIRAVGCGAKIPPLLSGSANARCSFRCVAPGRSGCVRIGESLGNASLWHDPRFPAYGAGLRKACVSRRKTDASGAMPSSGDLRSNCSQVASRITARTLTLSWMRRCRQAASSNPLSRRDIYRLRHGLRRTDQIRPERLVMTAAIARSAGASRTNIARLLSCRSFS